MDIPENEKKAVTQTPDVKFVVGIEDVPYFHWQLPILIESLTDKLPRGWELLVVVCNNQLDLSDSLTQIFQTYDHVKYFTTTNYPHNESIEFAAGGDSYVPINRIQALSAVADAVNSDDLICLLETDIFLYKDINLDIIPKANALAENWIIQEDIFFSLKRYPSGVSLSKLLESMGCTNSLRPGGVILFLTGETIQNQKFISDCFRFTQILYLMGKILELDSVWVAEMPCYSLALTVNGIPYDVIDDPAFSTENNADPEIRPGTFYHYYHDLRDGGDGAFYKSKWYKHLYHKKNFLHEDMANWSSVTHSDHEAYFFELATRARLRIPLANHLRLKEKKSKGSV